MFALYWLILLSFTRENFPTTFYWMREKRNDWKKFPTFIFLLSTSFWSCVFGKEQNILHISQGKKSICSHIKATEKYKLLRHFNCWHIDLCIHQKFLHMWLSIWLERVFINPFRWSVMDRRGNVTILVSKGFMRSIYKFVLTASCWKPSHLFSYFRFSMKFPVTFWFNSRTVVFLHGLFSFF